MQLFDLYFTSKIFLFLALSIQYEIPYRIKIPVLGTSQKNRKVEHESLRCHIAKSYERERNLKNDALCCVAVVPPDEIHMVH